MRFEIEIECASRDVRAVLLCTYKETAAVCMAFAFALKFGSIIINININALWRSAVKCDLRIASHNRIMFFRASKKSTNSCADFYTKRDIEFDVKNNSQDRSSVDAAASPLPAFHQLSAPG